MLDKFSSYTMIVTADHGGHQRSHGTDCSEDMTIPVFFRGKDITPGKINKAISITDIAPTIVNFLGVEPDSDWEGASIL